MNSEATEFTKKHLRIREGEDLETINVPFERVVQLMETFHATRSKNARVKSHIMFLTDKDIEDYATQEITEKAIPQKRNSFDVFMLKLGFEIGAKWMRNLVRKNI